MALSLSFILVQVSKWLEWLVVSALAPPVWSQGGRFWTLWQTWRPGIWSTSSTPNLSPAPTSLTRPCTFSQQSQTGNQTQQDACQHFFQDWQRWLQISSGITRPLPTTLLPKLTAQEQWVDEMIVPTGVDAVLCKNLHRGLLPVPHASCELWLVSYRGHN